MTDIDFFKNTDLFSELGNEAIMQICDLGKVEEYENGDVIHKEGTLADRIWMVLEGSVALRFDLPGRLTSEESTVSEVLKGKSFGWSSYVAPHKYRLSAYCVSSTCKVMCLEKMKLDQIFEQNKKFGYQFLLNLTKIVGSRLQLLQKTVR